MAQWEGECTELVYNNKAAEDNSEIYAIDDIVTDSESEIEESLDAWRKRAEVKEEKVEAPPGLEDPWSSSDPWSAADFKRHNSTPNVPFESRPDKSEENKVVAEFACKYSKLDSDKSMVIIRHFSAKYDYESSESDASSEMWAPESDGQETEEVLMEDDWAEGRCRSSADARAVDLSIVAGFWPSRRTRRSRHLQRGFSHSESTETSSSTHAPVPQELTELLDRVQREFFEARESGHALEVVTRRIDVLDSVDAIFESRSRMMSRFKPVEPNENEDVFVGTVRDESKMAVCRKLKHGITMDSGSAVGITPDDGNPQFKIVPLGGGRVGKRLGAANGTPIEVCGEKLIAFRTQEGYDFNWPFIAGKVKNTLKSVGTTCDASNYVIFRRSNGYIVHGPGNAFIEFKQIGNVYVIDVWVRVGSRADSESSSVARQTAVP